jgi:hypothetical protein
MKWILSLLILLALTTVVRSQQNYLDIIFLKDSTKVRGVIFEQIPDKSVRIITSPGDSSEYYIDQIEKIVREPVSRRYANSYVRTWFSPGYQLIIEGCLAYHVNKFGMDFYALTIINCIRLNKNFSLGLGTGLRHNFNHNFGIIQPPYEHLMVPVFTDFRTYIQLNKSVSAYFAADIGCSFSKNHAWGFFSGKEFTYTNGVGLLINPVAGIAYRISSRSALNIGVGYEMYKVSYDFSYYSGKYLVFDNGDKMAGSIGINAGVTF